MTQASWEATSSNNPYRASMVSQRTPMSPQRKSCLVEEPILDGHEYPPPRYQPYGSSVMSSRMSMAPVQRMSIIPERRSYSDVPSLDISEQSWDNESSSTPDDGYVVTSSRELPGGITPVTPKKDIWGVPEPPQHTSKRVLRKIQRLVKTHSKEVETITVFNSDDDIVCSYEAPGATKEKHRYIPTPDEGRYLRLALELGFKSEGCNFGFGTVTWLSGKQEEIDEKRTLLGSTANDPQAGNHQFYGVLSPTGRYVFAAILNETPSGIVSAKVMRKIRDLADKIEVYEVRAGSGGVMAKIEALLNKCN